MKAAIDTIEKAAMLRDLHIRHDPLILYNIWDAGSAAAVARAGAKAIATSSWSVAASQGHTDGEALPLDDMLAAIARISRVTDLPLTVDFEGGYAADPPRIRENVRRLLDLGVVGLNFEDQVVNGPGLFSIEDQAARLCAVREAADMAGVRAFINARTDVFLKAGTSADHSRLLDEALARQVAYEEAGADGFFVPGLTERVLIAGLCEAATLPINVMMTDDLKNFREMAALGVSRISFGPAPYIGFTADLEREAAGFF